MSQSAFIRVKDTTGIVELCKGLAQASYTIVSDDDNLKLLESSGVKAIPLFEFTGNQNACHPSVESFDIVVANCLNAHQDPPSDLVPSQIDLREAAVVRRAARIGDKVAVVTGSWQYAQVLAEVQGGGISDRTRRNLVVEAMAHLRNYDEWLERGLASSLLGESRFHLSFTDGTPLRYGENSHQSAMFYKEPCSAEASLASARQLHGKELSYNNIVDADAALEMVREFSGTPAVAIIKHMNPCGLATGATLQEAITQAWEGDPVSAYGSVIACTQEVDLATAQFLKGRFVEILLAPGFTPDALAFLQAKSKDIRILECGPIEAIQPRKVYKHVIGGLLVQDRDATLVDKWECVTKAGFPGTKDSLARFTWIVTKHTKSNAIVMGYEYKAGCFMILGLGPGQPNRIDSNQRLCQPRVRDNLSRLPNPEGLSPAEFEKKIFGSVVMGSDAFFPFPDNIEASHEAGVRYIVQPGGSKHDPDVIKACDQYGIAMIFTGQRHFRH